jgi:hypothetical protein
VHEPHSRRSKRPVTQSRQPEDRAAMFRHTRSFSRELKRYGLSNTATTSRCQSTLSFVQ